MGFDEILEPTVPAASDKIFVPNDTQVCIESDQKPTMIDRVEMTIALLGELTEEIHMHTATRVKT